MEKIKSFLKSEKGKDVLVVIIVILTGLGSFELGRLSVENSSEGVKIEPQGQNSGQDDNTTQPQDSTQTSMNSTDVVPLDSGGPTSVSSAGKTFFASSKGSKYYSTSCSAGKTIKPENKVWFTTGKEAEAAGYTLSSACQ